VTNLERAWAELDGANTMRWTISRPSMHDEVRGAEHWELYAFDPREKPRAGKRSREWTAVGRTEVECVREMARCLCETSEGRVPS
jgi:hypothetical protein